MTTHRSSLPASFSRVRSWLTTSALAAVLSSATAAELTVGNLAVKEGFQAELLYTVPKDTQGSWVAMTVDPKGRLIVSDQYGALYRVVPPALGAPADTIKVEALDVKLSHDDVQRIGALFA